jgi:hypothetical protein
MKAEAIALIAKEKELKVVELKGQGLRWGEIGAAIGTSARYAADLYKRAGYRSKYAAEAQSDPLGGLSRRALSVLKGYNDSPTSASTTKAQWAEFVAARPERFDPRSKKKARGMSFGTANEIFDYLGLPRIRKATTAPRCCPYCSKSLTLPLPSRQAP